MALNVRGLAVSPYCAQCPCAKDGKPVKPVPAFGGTGSLCIVGEAPGKEESRQGFPFIGPSGQIVNKALRRAGGDRQLVFVANALLCQRPSRDDDFDFAVECCRERLRDDLETAQPTAICALGGTAMKALQLPVRFVSQARGTVQESPLLPGVPVIGAIHPAALLHGGAGEMTAGGKQKMNVDAQAMFLFSDVAKTLAIAQGKVPPTWSDDILVVHEAAEVAPAMQKILEDIYIEGGPLGIDLEWACEGSKNALDALGADAWRAIISWVGISCRKRAVSFKWEALVADFDERQARLDDDDARYSGLALLEAVMEDPNMPKLAHNKQADKAIWEAQIATFANAVGLTGMIEGQFWDCYLESETEFLTRSGWKRYRQVTKRDRLATVNASGEIEFQAYQERIARPFSGQMYEIATPHTRAVVTPTHRLWCRPIRRTSKAWHGEALGPWQLLTVEGALASSTDTFEVQRAGRPEEKRSILNSVDLAGALLPFHAWLDRPWLPWMRLFGIWLTDGTLQYVKGIPRAISISQKKFGPAYELLQALAYYFPLHYTETVRYRRGRRRCIECRWNWNNTQIAKAFRALFGRYSKSRSLPDWVWDLQIRERRELLQAMFLGDSHRRGKTTCYNTFSSALADRIQALALSVGWPATCQHDSGGYHVHVRCEDAPICQIRSRVQNAKEGRNNGSLKAIRVVKGRKVCFSVPNQRLVTRSGGRPAFHGNSMLMHHGAFPGIDHDLQQVASQFLCVPPWKVDHAKRAAEHEAQLKEQAKAEKAKVKEEKKAAKKLEHEASNAAKAAEAAEKKAKRKAEHEARNAQLKAEGEARKAQRKAEHEARNAAAAVEARARKSRPAPYPKQKPAASTDDGPSMADEDTARMDDGLV